MLSNEDSKSELDQIRQEYSPKINSRYAVGFLIGEGADFGLNVMFPLLMHEFNWQLLLLSHAALLVPYAGYRILDTITTEIAMHRARRSTPKELVHTRELDDEYREVLRLRIAEGKKGEAFKRQIKREAKEALRAFILPGRALGHIFLTPLMIRSNLAR